MNFMISILGWFLWNLAEFTMAKQELDEDGNPNTNMNFSEYKHTHWPSWIGSFFSTFLLLWIGYRQLNLEPFQVITGGESLAWNDLYYLGAGAAWEAFLWLVKKIRKHFKNKPV